MKQNEMEWNEFNEWDGMEWNEIKLSNLVWMF